VPEPGRIKPEPKPNIKIRAGAENTQRTVGQVVRCRFETLVISVSEMIEALRQGFYSLPMFIANLEFGPCDNLTDTRERYARLKTNALEIVTLVRGGRHA
jgi:hypothetical protein